MAKVSLIGAGNVGATAAQYLAERAIAEVLLTDIVPDVAVGKALDLAQAGPVRGYATKVSGLTVNPRGDLAEYARLAGSDVIIVTAGLPRKPGMSREDLLGANVPIIRGVGEQIKKYAPGAVVIVVTNPLDTMCWLMRRATGFPDGRVLGMAGILDTARFRAFLAAELGCHPAEIQAMVLGGHGDEMVPLLSSATVGGIPVRALVGAEKLAAIVARTRQGGGEIGGLLKTGSAFYAPGAAAAQMAEAILLDQRRILPCAAWLTGQYGLRGMYFGVPVRLARAGVAEVLEVPLAPEERAELEQSAASVRASVAALEQLL
jgi:malate dehydrogenase